MKHLLFFLALFAFVYHGAMAQQTGYYNGADGKSGDELQTALNTIIKDHKTFSYSLSSTVFESSDQDPDNPENIILVYTGRSNPNDDYGSGGDYINREHVWAKSHGDIGTEPPEGSDFHNLKPADASVNMDRSNLDFDNGGEQHPEATECYYDSDSWEPRDEVKGDIARILFYMATRYEGDNGEQDLRLVDEVDTYPEPEHGKLSTLLEWNEQDPPDAFERNRNNVIFQWQQNRNPFIDNPEWASLIWGDASPNPIIIDAVNITNEEINSDDAIEIQAEITSNEGSISTATIMWGLDYDALTNEVSMNASGDTFTGSIPAQAEEETVYYKIVASDGTNNDETVVYNYYIPPEFNGELVTIYDIQGQQEHSPMADQIQDGSGTEELNYGEVSTSGIVTGNFGEFFFIQDGEGPWNGMMVYDDNFNPQIGDSIILTGLIKEYYNMTEMIEVSGYYHIASGKAPPEPTIINTGDASEQYEGVLVKVMQAECTFDSYWDDYGMWRIDDGSGALKIHNSAIFEYNPTEGEVYNVMGPLNFDFEEFKIELRNSGDVTTEQDVTAPEIASVGAESSTEIEINFSESVEKESAENTNNYAINGGLTISEADRYILDDAKVILSVSEMTEDETYELTVSGISDMSGNTMDETTTEFTFSSEGIAEFIDEESISFAPNPFREMLQVSMIAKKPANGFLAIRSIEGKLLQKHSISVRKGENTFSVIPRYLESGNYLMIIELNNNRSIKKIIKR